MTYLRQDQARVTVAIDGVNLGVCNTLDGGDLEADAVTFKPGGMAPQVSLGGPVKMTDVKVTLGFTETIAALIPWLESRVGKGEAVVTVQRLDADRNPFGAPRPITGVLTAKPNETHDSDSNDALLVELTISPNAPV